MLFPGRIEANQFHPALAGVYERLALVLDIRLGQVYQLVKYRCATADKGAGKV